MASTDASAEPASAGDTTQPVLEAKEESHSKEEVPLLEPQPIREDQVINAVRFLSHPNVRKSPVMHRRSFLEKKGLSKEEIDEAFRRVPDSPPDKLTSVPAAREGQHKMPNLALQSQSQHLAVPSQQQSLVNQPVESIPLPIVQARSPRNWSMLFMAIGFFTAASFGAGAIVMKVLIPKFKAWVQRIVLEEEDTELTRQRKAHAVEEVSALAAAIAAANSAAAAATQVAEASREMIRSRDGELQQFTTFAKSLENSIQDLSNIVKGVKLSSATAEQRKELVRSPLNAPAVDIQKVQVNSAWRTVSPVEGSPKGADPLQVQFSSNMRKGGILNSNMSSISMTENVRRSASSTEGWNQSTSNPQLKPLMSNDATIEERWLHHSGSPNVSGVKIAEIDPITDARSNSNGNLIGPSNLGSRKESDFKDDDVSVKTSRQSWVPPPVPPTIMPGAATAIRYSKTVLKDEVQILPNAKTGLSDSSGTGLQSSNEVPFIEKETAVSTLEEAPELSQQENPLPKDSLEAVAENVEEL